MIDEAIDYIRREVRDFLGVLDAEVIAGNIHELKENGGVNGLFISLVNLDEESTLRNTNHVVRQNNGVAYQQPPIHLNLYILFTADFANYGTSMLRLSQTIELFQSKPAFSSENQSAANAFPAILEKLIFNFCNLNFEQLNHLWGILGGKYFPSVLYKVRLVKVQNAQVVAGPEITTIQVDTNLR